MRTSETQTESFERESFFNELLLRRCVDNSRAAVYLFVGIAESLRYEALPPIDDLLELRRRYAVEAHFRRVDFNFHFIRLVENVLLAERFVLGRQIEQAESVIYCPEMESKDENI